MIFYIWCAVIIIQTGITVFLASKFLNYRKTKPKEDITLSIVIAAHDELANLKKLIPALLKQDYPKFEIIIALDRCTDGSIDFLRGIAEDRLNWIEIPTTPADWNEKKYALAQAIKKASGDWLVFTDADCIPATDQWLCQFSSKTEKNEIILGYSPYRSTGSLLQSFIQYESFVTAFHYLAMTLVGKPYMAVGRNMAIKRAFFHDCGGYESFKGVRGGDDDLFIQKNADKSNTTVILGRESAVYTFPEKNWKSYIKQKTRHLAVGSHYRLRDQLLHILNDGSILLFWALIPALIQRNIWPIILFYLFVKGISYRFAHSKMGVGFNYLLLPCVDIMYAIFLPIIAIRSKLIKDITWKN